jgi:hypothetical protein
MGTGTAPGRLGQGVAHEVVAGRRTTEPAIGLTEFEV